MAAVEAQRDDRRKVLDATDIVRLIDEHITLRPKGREFIGLCPFHDDHTPSMYVVPAKQIYHCFSCGAGGNALDFAIHFHNLEFLEALRLLADRAGIELTDTAENPRQRRDASAPSRSDLRAATAFAQEFFRLALTCPGAGEAARRVIGARGIRDEMVERFGLGVAPEGWDHLLTTAKKKGLSARVLLDAGLIKPSKDGRGDGYDTFRNRLTFPIYDATGRPIAFGGRRLRDEDDPKYLNSPESPLFDKSATLFGLHLAARPIQKVSVAVVTEGYTDVIACHQAGVTNVVATLGTALTPKHARVLQRLCSRVVLLFDGDEAGERAAERALDVFFGAALDVSVAALPEGKDPADLLAEVDGAERFAACVGSATDALDHRLDALRRRLVGVGLSERSALVEEAVRRFAELGLDAQTPFRRRLIIRRIAEAAGVSEGDIARSLAARRARPSARSAVPPPDDRGVIDPALLQRPDTRALAALLADPSLLTGLSDAERDILDPGAYAPGPLRVIAQALGGATGAEPSSEIIDRMEDSAGRAFATGLIATVLEENDSDRDRLASHLRHFIASILRARALSATEETEAGGSARSLAERIAARRRAIQEFGDDPLAIPRVLAGAADPERALPQT